MKRLEDPKLRGDYKTRATDKTQSRLFFLIISKQFSIWMVIAKMRGNPREFPMAASKVRSLVLFTWPHDKSGALFA